MKTVVSVLVTLVTITPGVAAQDVVDAAQVAAASQRGAIIWDVRSTDDYLRGHPEGVAPVPTDMNLAAGFPRSRQALLVDREPVHLSTMDDLPDLGRAGTLPIPALPFQLPDWDRRECSHRSQCTCLQR